MSLAPWREGQETDESVQTCLYGVCVLHIVLWRASINRRPEKHIKSVLHGFVVVGRTASFQA